MEAYLSKRKERLIQCLVCERNDEFQQGKLQGQVALLNDLLDRERLKKELMKELES